jgi:hypothetical protein
MTTALQIISQPQEREIRFDFYTDFRPDFVVGFTLFVRSALDASMVAKKQHEFPDGHITPFLLADALEQMAQWLRDFPTIDQEPKS